MRPGEEEEEEEEHPFLAIQGHLKTHSFQVFRASHNLWQPGVQSAMDFELH
jgi:hypothetical protein